MAKLFEFPASGSRFPRYRRVKGGNDSHLKAEAVRKFQLGRTVDEVSRSMKVGRNFVSRAIWEASIGPGKVAA